MRKIATNNTGFTLIETIISLGVFAIAIFALFSTLAFSIKGNAKASQITTLVNWGSHEVERLIRQQYGDMRNTDPISISGDNTYTVSRTVLADTPVTNVKQVIVTVACPTGGKQVLFRYYKANESAK
jgi:Tfp pilus assembly protein PilV